MKNDEGIAYGLIAVVMFIGMVALIFICFTPALNGVIGAAKSLLVAGRGIAVEALETGPRPAAAGRTEDLVVVGIEWDHGVPRVLAGRG